MLYRVATRRSALNVRSGPGKRYSIVRALAHGRTINITTDKVENGFRKIGYREWAKAKFLVPAVGGPAPGPTSPPGPAPTGTLKDKVVAILEDTSIRINFRCESRRVWPSAFRIIARYVRADRIKVQQHAPPGRVFPFGEGPRSHYALYKPAVGPDKLNILSIPVHWDLGPVTERSSVVHEAVHALADRSAGRPGYIPLISIKDEIAAYLAQVMYLRLKGIRNWTTGRWWNAVFDAAQPIADRLLRGEGYEVSLDERLDLEAAIRNRDYDTGRVYDDMATDIIPYDGIG